MSTVESSTCPLSTLITFITHHFEGGVFPSILKTKLSKHQAARVEVWMVKGNLEREIRLF